MENLKSFCQKLANDLQFDVNAFKEDSSRGFSLEVEENMQIKIAPLNEGISLYCALAACPQNNLEHFFTEIMDCNLYGYATRGYVLGLSKNDDFLTLSVNIDYPVDYQLFSQILQDFYDTCLFWKGMAINNLNLVE